MSAAAAAGVAWPTTREEAWRYFPTRALERYTLAGPMGLDAAALALAGAAPGHPRVVLVNGQVASGIDALPAGVALGLAEGPATVPEDGLAAANRAYGRPLVLTVAPRAAAGSFRAPELLEIVHVAAGDGVAHPALVVELAPHASLVLVQRFVGAGAYLVNARTHATLGDAATLAHVKLVLEDHAASHVDAVAIEVGRDARYQGFVVSLGGARVRTAPRVRLQAPGASCEVDGLYLGEREQVLDHTALVEHLAPHTRSRATWAGVLDGKATGTFQGNVSIARAAVKAKTRELTRTLLVSPTATANAKPELRIDVDDVEASHGATVGSLDPAQLFYLEARGVAPDVARKMLVGAFVAETVALAPAAAHAMINAALAGRVVRAHEPDDVEGDALGPGADDDDTTL